MSCLEMTTGSGVSEKLMSAYDCINKSAAISLSWDRSPRWSSIKLDWHGVTLGTVYVLARPRRDATHATRIDDNDKTSERSLSQRPLSSFAAPGEKTYER